MKTALFYHPIFLKHDTGPHHPERPSRLEAILRKLKKDTLFEKLRLIEPKPATLEEIELVHSKDYVLEIEGACSRLRPLPPRRWTNSPTSEVEGVGLGLPTEKHFNLDPDTVISRDSFEAATYASGAVIDAADLIFTGEIERAFCMVRPPGHHALRDRAMGFCIFNNIAIGARYLQKKYNLARILILDWDVHHGNGTEEIFSGDKGIFYISLHEYPHYPGTGAESTLSSLNIPMPHGSGDNEYLKAFKEIISPKIKDFKPEFILISAGFDGHRDDPLSSINLTESGYEKMTELIKEAAGEFTKNRLISVLEGGYNLISLSSSVSSHLKALA